MKFITSLALCALLVAVIAQPSVAEANIGFKGIGLRLSYVSPDNIDDTLGAGILVDLGRFSPRIGFGASADFWYKSMDPVDFWDIVIGANSRYLLAGADSKLQPYAGAGLALHIFFSKLSIEGGMESTDTEYKIGADFFGGTELQLGGSTALFAEVMYRALSESQLMFSGGFMVRFGSGE